MLKWAAIFFVIMVAAGIFGFVIDATAWIAKVLFFGCLIAFAVSVFLGRKRQT